MDLLATVRKEGSRGGTGDFKWSDVQASSRRENYLGHSLMAPVGRWQKGRDLNWYAKTDAADNEDEEARAARERKEELRRVKEAEEDAMARALGLPVPDRTNPNLQALGDKHEIDKVLKNIDGRGFDGAEHGVGFGTGSTNGPTAPVVTDRIEGNAEAQDHQLQNALKEYKRRHRHNSRERKRSRSGDRRRRRHDRDRSEERHHHRQASRDRQRRRTRRAGSRSRSTSRTRYEDRDRRHRHERSRSPRRRDDRHRERDRRQS